MLPKTCGGEIVDTIVKCSIIQNNKDKIFKFCSVTVMSLRPVIKGSSYSWKHYFSKVYFDNFPLLEFSETWHMRCLVSNIW